jgi:transcription elongation factor GreA
MERKEDLELRLQILTKESNEVAKKRQDARQLGDLSENAEYASATEELESIQGEIAKVQEQLDAIAVGKEQTYKYSGYISEGSQVTLQYPNGALRGILLVAPHLADITQTPMRISVSSPVGIALEGKSVGEKITIITAQKETQYSILEVS